MKIGNKKISTTTIALLCVIGLLSSAFAVVLFTLNKSGSWSVNTSLGLELYDETNTSVISALSWNVNAQGSQQVNYTLRNLSNKAVNVTMTLPSNTSDYQFTTTWVDQEIAQDGSVSFSITLTDINMDSAQVYNGNFAWEIVDSFPEVNEDVTFETTEVAYLEDMATLVLFTGENFDKSLYVTGETVNYQFTTKNIATLYNIDSFSYKIDLYNGTTWIQELYSGMKDCIPDLEPNQEITVSRSFSAPLDSGMYKLKLTYTGHNSEPITYTATITSGIGGSTTPSGTVTQALGSTLQIQANANSGYHFLHWVIDGSTYTANPITITFNQDHNVNAVFEVNPVATQVTLTQSGSTTGISFWRLSTQVTMPYVYSFAKVQVGNTFQSEQMTVKNSGAIQRFMYVSYTYSGLPSGYELRMYTGTPTAYQLWTSNKLEIDSVVQDSGRWFYQIVNLSGNPDADFSAFQISFNISTSP